MLFHSPDLDDLESEVLKRIDELRRRLGHGLSNPTRWHGQLRRVAFAKAIRGSNTIEGYNVTVDDAIAAVEGDEPLDADAETWAAVSGYQDAMTYVLQLADDPHFVFSENLIRSLHFMMMSYDLSKYPGRWRPGDDTVVVDQAIGEVVHVPPSHTEVPGLMRELVDYLNTTEELHGMIKAAMAHLNLTMVHPFKDGNGRMARCLQSLVLARTGILSPPFSSIEEYLGRNTEEYYRVLAEVGQGSWNPTNETRPWIRFCLTAHYRQAATILRRMRKIGELWDSLEDELSRRRLPSRMIYALADAAIGLKVRNSSYRSHADISAGLASKDLKTLVDYRLLLPRGERRGRFYVATPEIRALGTEVSDKKRIGDPFEELVDSTPLIPGLLSG